MNVANIQWSPNDYADAAIIAKEAGQEMLARLDWVKLQPKVILDIGCGTGELSAALQKRYPEASVLSIDHAPSMLKHAKDEHGAMTICAPAEKLPVADQSVDLIVANFLLPWHNDVAAVFAEWRRVMSPEGLLMVTALGPDTLREWRSLWSADDMPNLADMHEIGDALVHVGFSDPVVDVDYCTLTYRDPLKLITELQKSGMLSNEIEPQQLAPLMHKESETWNITYEIVQVHTWAPPATAGYTADDEGVAKIPLASLRRKLRG